MRHLLGFLQNLYIGCRNCENNYNRIAKKNTLKYIYVLITEFSMEF